MMSRIVLVALVAVLLPARVLALWPLPRELHTGAKNVRLASNFKISASFSHVPSDLSAAIERTEQWLKNDQLAPLTVGRGQSDFSGIKGATELKALTLTLPSHASIQSISTEAVKSLEDRDDSYTLSIPSTGASAVLSADTTLGLLRGLTTFSQLWYTVNGVIYTSEAPISISDKPGFVYRGFMLDTARNFFPVSDIQRTLDAMSMVKMNVFHWHVVDSQSFALQIPGFEELSQNGAYSPSEVYSKEDVQNIISYAAARGIDVMVEIDTPGHTAIFAESHPDFVACPQFSPWATYANEPPSGQLRFALPEVVSYTQNLFKALAEMFPSTMFSTGGDEINQSCYDWDGPTQEQLNKTGFTFEETLSNFTVATHSILTKQGKTPVVWEEMVLAHNVTLSNDTIVMVWISSEDALGVAEKGFRFVHAPSNYFYLDCGAGGWVGDFPTGNSWCEPFKTWQNAYTFDPFANLTTDQQHLVLGGEQLLWTEQSGPQNMDPIIWPRAAASAELFWTFSPGGEPLDDETALPRMHDISFRMRQRGIDTISLQPLWCALRPGVCDLTA